jgi:hypothetical protein
LCRTGSDCHVGAAEVVVDGSDHADDVEVAVGKVLLLGDQVPLQKLAKKLWKKSGPVRPEGFVIRVQIIPKIFRIKKN